ncbi:MAG TPA: LysM peptidoglycan-binding domain-containing protein, partial [Solirubrobacterales bacterium]|nr:LysM peptidoglycan-binding domain-containing protein [Solirubrobacterales bacterium]
MAHKRLTSISMPRSGPPAGRKLLASLLCVLLVFGSILPGFAVAGEADSEGEGTGSPIEVPVSPPDFDPGGEEDGLEEEPASDAEEEAGEVGVESPPPEEVTSAPAEAPIEGSPSPPPTAVPEPESSAPEPETVQQKATDSSQPVANDEIVGPRDTPASGSAAPGGAQAPAAPTQQEAPAPSTQLVATPPADPGRNLGGKDSYIVRPGDCLWHIAAAVLPTGSDTQAIEDKVAELWRMNEDRIGTGDPNLIYPGTVLR